MGGGLAEMFGEGGEGAIVWAESAEEGGEKGGDGCML